MFIFFIFLRSLWAVGSATTDILIALALVLKLRTYKSPFKRTKSCVSVMSSAFFTLKSWTQDVEASNVFRSMDWNAYLDRSRWHSDTLRLISNDEYNSGHWVLAGTRVLCVVLQLIDMHDETRTPS